MREAPRRAWCCWHRWRRRSTWSPPSARPCCRWRWARRSSSSWRSGSCSGGSSFAALGQLAGTIAHELGNPLNALSGHLQLLARRPDLAEPARSQVAVLQGEVTRMTQIIRRFLDQTRGFTPAAETVELAPLVDEALDLTLGMEARQRIQS